MSIPTLETERLVLRAWRESDLDAFAEFWADEATARFVGGVCNREDAWRRLALQMGHWTLRGHGNWALEEKSSRRWVGYSGVWFPEGWPEPEISWSLHSAFQGRGYATEAARRVRAFAYEDLGRTTIVSMIVAPNQSSLRVAARLGAVRERDMELRGYVMGIYRHLGPEQLKQQSAS